MSPRTKIDGNTYERSPALDPNVKTFQPPELVATKIRALYQWSKARNVFDLWAARTELKTDPFHRACIHCVKGRFSR
ncbi:nucleotidyl transferase AbiEii/AbiGii toxin family protein [Mycobacterium malmoense]|uniref:nucleotidyl transferase AbiEii/AbiGii toxin family protein n=1 Tax=Mycobacterium malmoense TaxID=1780 RepID=UPI001C43139C